MPGIVKIGRTIRCVNGRANELYQTGVPMPFDVAFSIYSPNCEELEIRAHEKFTPERVNAAREFFKVTVNEASQYLEDELRYQVECLLEEFMPDHYIVHADEFVDIGNFKPSFYHVAAANDLFPPDVVEALYQLEGEEAAPAIERAKAAADQRMADYVESKEDEGAQA